MYAKRIFLRNFKSFPKTTVELERTFSAVVGPNGSGKCVRGDTRVLLSNGRLIPIRELVDEALSRQSSELDDGFVSLSSGQWSVVSLNPSTLKMEGKPVTALVKRKSPETLFEITTRAGRTVIATSYHPVLTVQGGEVRAVNADQLQEGAFVAVPRTLRLGGETFSPLMAMARMDLDVYAGYSSKLKSELYRVKQLRGWTWKQVAAQSGVSWMAFKGFLDGQALRLNAAYRLTVFVGYSDFEFSEWFRLVKSKNYSIFSSIPTELSPDLARFLGLVLSEGRLVKNEVFFYNHDEELLRDFCRLSESLFGIVPTVRNYRGNQVAILPSRPVSLMLEHVFGMTLFGGSRSKKVPEPVLNSSDEVVRSFVSGLFDGDGFVSSPDQPKAYLEYVSASPELVDGLWYLFLRLGIVSRLSKTIKAATNTIKRTRRSYARLSVFGQENLRRFAEFVPLRQAMRLERLSVWSSKRVNANPNVDVVPGLNPEIRRVLQKAGYSSRKLKGVAPSRIRSYYENRALPSRAGLMAVQQLVQSDALARFAESDVFWDQIRSIRQVPGEEWVYDLCVEGNHNFVAEGLFVHNSNIVDGLMFAFGEMRLKSLRVKSTKDLIFKNANVAEVRVLLAEDDARDFTVGEVEERGKKRRIFPKGVHEVARLIRKDGKTKYVLDGKAVKKYVIEDFLSKHSLSLYNVIKQGEVQRIVEMNSRDRRTLIDFVANVSEYEDKKGEALGELATVDSRLREAQTVFAEKEGYLKELAEDKKNAETYLKLEEDVKTLSATLLHVDVKSLERQFEALVSSNLDYRNKVEALQANIKSLEAGIDAAHQEKDRLNQTIMEKSHGRERELQRAIDALAAAIDSGKAVILDKKEQLKRLREKRKTVALDHQKAGNEVKGFDQQRKTLAEDVESVKKTLERDQGELNALLGKSEKLSSSFFDARKRMQKYEQDMQAAKDALNALQAEMSKQEEIQKVKEQELARLKKGLFDDFSPRKKELLHALKNAESALRPFDRALREHFEQEKALNQRVPALEDLWLDLKEKIAETEGRLRLASDFSSAGLEAVMRLREKNEGIYGTLGELIRYSSKYSVPVGVALGNRLQYVVVDSVKTAGTVIDYLKKNNLGRVSFIPLDKIHSPPAEEKLADKPGAAGMLLDLLEFDSMYRKAVQYACANTVVFDSFDAASKLAGKARMVTLGGELFEPSGLVSGGKSKEKINAYAEQAKLAEYQKKFEKIKGEKESVVSELYALREAMSEERKKKAEAELQFKRVELELEHVQQSEKAVAEQQKDVHAAIRSLESEIAQSRKVVEQADEDRGSWVKALSDLNVAYLDAKQLVDVEKEQHFGSLVKEKEHKVSELKITSAKLENELRALDTQKNLYARQYAGVEKELSELNREEDAGQAAIQEAEAKVAQARTELQEKTLEQKSLSKELSEFIEKREALEKKAMALGNEKGKLQLTLEKLSLEKQDSELKRVAVETKLLDLKAQFEQFQGVQIIQNKTDKDKGDLLLRKKESEEKLRAMGQINLRALELYDQKVEELQRQKTRVVQLENEKNTVLLLIEEIESKKKATFMEVFHDINSAFKKLFKTIFKGDGTLFLENPDLPFEGGLTIQVQLENKEIKYLELMSGGEKSLIALLFLFAIQSKNPSSIYILDEADAALDQENSRKLALLLKQLATQTQFLVVSHNDTLYKHADCLVGVSMGPEGSNLVEVRLHSS
ncbi:AAA family ATPase [Candidatus Micrarchaeota archaeon]|nr:AAA family ATPase [Candidatus Micrarchaeota archaeon]